MFNKDEKNRSSPQNKSTRFLFELFKDLSSKNNENAQKTCSMNMCNNIYSIYLFYCDQFILTSFCSNIIWLYNLWNCSKSRRSFFAPTSCKSRTIKAQDGINKPAYRKFKNVFPNQVRSNLSDIIEITMFFNCLCPSRFSYQ